MGGLVRATDDRQSGRAFGPACVGLTVAFCLFGCSDYGPPKSTEGLQNLQPVTGSVSFGGEPTPGAVVFFFPVADLEAPDRRIAGIVEVDGTFEMKSTVGAGSRPGVEPGEYLVSVSWTELVNPSDRDSDEGPDKLPERYKDPKTSGLRAEIVEGTNELPPFELTP